MRKLFCLVGVCVFALGASPAMANGGKEFEVDDDRAQCKKAGFTSIQAAVDAAAARPGKDTIVVCPGLYQEQVRIEGPAQDGLRLEAKKHTKLDRDATADPAREAIIKFPAIALPTTPRALVLVRDAESVQVSGFRITGPYVFPPAPSRSTGPSVSASTGTAPSSSITTGSPRSAMPTRLSAAARTASPCRSAGRSRVRSAGRAIDHNLIDLYEKNGPTIDGPGSFAWIHHNAIFGEGPTPVVAQNGLQVGRGAGAKVEYNLVADNNYLPPTNAGLRSDPVRLRQARRGPQPGGAQ